MSSFDGMSEWEEGGSWAEKRDEDLRWMAWLVEGWCMDG